jgi:ADP-L-glycero-D-manno-heptose 6-epimerase
MPDELRERYQYYTCADTDRLRAAGYAAGPDRFRQQVARYVREYLLPGRRHLAEVAAAGAPGCPEP